MDVSLNQVNTSVQMSNQELQQLKNGVKTNKSTEFASLHNQSISNAAKNNVQLNSKFQSAPSTPTKNQGVKKLLSQEE